VTRFAPSKRIPRAAVAILSQATNVDLAALQTKMETNCERIVAAPGEPPADPRESAVSAPSRKPSRRQFEHGVEAAKLRRKAFPARRAGHAQIGRK
jgi:hypothetical protein